MKQIVCLLAILACSLILAIGPKDTTMPTDRDILFDKAIDAAGTHLMVTRGADRGKSIFASWPQSEQLDRSKRHNFEMPGNFYDVCAELVPPDGKPLVLSSFLRCEYPEVLIDRGVVVLDSLVEHTSVAFALAEGADLAIWQIGLPGNSSVSLGLRGWTLNAARHLLSDKFVAVKLGRTDAGLLTVLVSEIGTGQHSQYEQSGLSDFQFKIVRQWREAKKE